LTQNKKPNKFKKTSNFQLPQKFLIQNSKIMSNSQNPKNQLLEENSSKSQTSTLENSEAKTSFSKPKIANLDNSKTEIPNQIEFNLAQNETKKNENAKHEIEKDEKGKKLKIVENRKETEVEIKIQNGIPNQIENENGKTQNQENFKSSLKMESETENLGQGLAQKSETGDLEKVEIGAGNKNSEAKILDLEKSLENNSGDNLANKSENDLVKELETWQKKFGYLRVFCLVLVLIIGILAGFSQRNGTFSNSNNSVLENQTRKLIETEFLFDKPSEKDLTDGKLKGLVSALKDPYSEFLTADDSIKAENRLNNRYVGIGIQFDFKNGVKIQKILKNSPASRSNLQVDDELIAVNGEKISQIKIAELADKIRGEEGTIAKLEIKRTAKNNSSEKSPNSTNSQTNPQTENFQKDSQTKNSTLTVEIKREAIVGELIELEVRDNTGIITISSFGDNLDEKMTVIAKKIKENSQIQNLILDLRGNGGGLLDQTVAVSSYFLTPNSLIVQEKSKTKTEKLYSSSKSISLASFPLRILIDSGSASASEIMAAALRDNRQIPLVGQKSFGKGIVQRVFNLNDGNKVKLTIEQWLTPKNTEIHKVGLTPDQIVPENEDILEFALKN